MSETSHQKNIELLKQKFDAINQDLEVHLQGLLWSKPITYWDYIQTDALLNLQTQRTSLPDEMVFIMYHQVNELLFKMVLWEAQQICENKEIDFVIFEDKINRIVRYFDMLTNSFSIMQEGMSVEQYNKFRLTLTPASGFQSAQYRLIEFAMTDVKNLIDSRFKDQYHQDMNTNDIIQILYWQAAGTNHKTGEKTYLIKEFEKKYNSLFTESINYHKKTNLYSVFKNLEERSNHSETLTTAMRHLDYTINVSWVMAHYKAAKKYIESSYGNGVATGGSDWQKYMLPMYQKRIFFPKLWSQQELNEWGVKEYEALENVAI